MKTQFIKLDNYNIIISDEKTKGGDYFMNLHDFKIGKYNKNQIPPQSPYVSKIIASENSDHDLPPINYNGFEEELGVVNVDVNELANLEYNNSLSTISESCVGVNAYIKGFNKAKSIYNKKYNEKDIQRAIDKALTFINNASDNDIAKFSMSHRMWWEYLFKSLDIEIEVEDSFSNNSNYEELQKEEFIKIPKIVNNQIKITDIV